MYINKKTTLNTSATDNPTEASNVLSRLAVGVN